MLTEKQIQNIRKLPKEDLISIMHECAEELGLVSVKEYCQATGMNRRTVYDYIQQNKIKCFEISKHKFPLVNY